MRSILCLLAFVAATTFSAAQMYELTATQNDETLGTMKFRLLPSVAPKHAAFVAARISEGFYNGSAFHRVIPNFMIQGGDPNSVNGPRETWGYGGYKESVVAEFTNTPHLRGTISAARTQDPNSFSGQFFICVAPASWLDGQYSVFGEVLSGMDVADKIVSAPRDNVDNPLDKISMQIELVTSVDEELTQQAVSVYPLPARTSMVVTVEAPSQLRVLDLNGSVVAEINGTVGANQLDVSQLSCGAYVLEAETSKGVTYRPILIADQ